MKKVCIISLSENTQIYDLVTKQAIKPLVKKKKLAQGTASQVEMFILFYIILIYFIL